MENRTLLILPGGGDPENEKYAKVYDVILRSAKQLNYRETIVHRWTGQYSCNRSGVINFSEATHSAVALLRNLESKDVGYDVICRSFGTGVFLNACQSLVLRRIGFASLWGIPSYTAFYELFKENIIPSIESAKTKGLNIDGSFFETLIPYELLLTRFTQSFRLNVANGAEDIYSPPAFHEFLRKICTNSNIHFSLVPGPHEISYQDEEYLNSLFTTELDVQMPSLARDGASLD